MMCSGLFQEGDFVLTLCKFKMGISGFGLGALRQGHMRWGCTGQWFHTVRSQAWSR